MLKRTLSMLLSVAMIMFNFSGVVVFAENTNTLTATAEKTYLKAGESTKVVLHIRLEDVVRSIGVSITYDNALLEFGKMTESSDVLAENYSVFTDYSEHWDLMPDAGEGFGIMLKDKLSYPYESDLITLTFTALSDTTTDSVKFVPTLKQSGKTYPCDTASIPHEHTLDSGTVNIPPSCTEYGQMIYTCTVCGQTFEEDIAPKDHDVSTVWSKDDTNHWHGCANCDEHFDEAAHTWNDGEDTTSASCTEPGVKTFTCTVCGQTRTEEIPVVDHEISTEWSKDENNHWHDCANCDEKFESAAHTWDDGVDTIPATEISTGVKTFTCEVCGQTRTQEIPVLDHVHVPAAEWSKDENNHWHGCAGCEEHLDEAAHTWNDGEDTTTASCTEPGVKTFTCTVCGQTRTQEIPAPGHEVSSAWSKDENNHWKTCANCDEKFESAAHTWDEGIETIPASCTKPGVKTYTCTVCGQTRTAVIPATGHEASTVWSKDENSHWHDCANCDQHIDEAAHTWNAGTETTPASCTEPGVKTYTCTVCGQTKTETILAPGHQVSTEWSKDENNHWHGCANCDEKFESAAHTWDEGVETTPASCTKPGVKTYTCEVCGQTKTAVIPAPGHEVSTVWSKDDTNHWKTCANCDEKFESAAHTWDEGIDTIPATETSTGVKTLTCTVCGQTKTSVIPKLDHVHVPAAEWSKDENTHWHDCSGCDEHLSEAAHTWDEGIETKKAKCLVPGEMTYTCTVCGQTRTAVIPAPGHDVSAEWSKDDTNHWKTCSNCDDHVNEAAHTWNAGVETTPASCTEAGEKTFTCTVCGQTRTQEIPSKGHEVSTVWSKDEDNHWHDCANCDEIFENAVHTWDSGEVTTAATCTAKGVKTYTCTVCGQTRTEDIQIVDHNISTAWSKDNTDHWHECTNCHEKFDSAAHTWDEGTETKTAKCNIPGEMTYTCTVCGQTKTEAIPAKEHQLSAEWSKDENNHWKTCANCDEQVDKAAHTWENTATAAASCTEPGSKTYTCTVCGETREEIIPARGYDSAVVPVVSGPRVSTGGGALAPSVTTEEEPYTWNAKVTGNTLTWESKPGADKFIISAKKPGDTKWTRVGTTTKTSYKLPGTLDGTYTFMVRYVKDDYIAPARLCARVSAELSAVRAKKSGSEYVVLNWYSVNGAKKYRVYRYKNGKYVKVGATKHHQLMIKGSAGDKFAVKAFVDGKWILIGKVTVE